MSLYRQTQNFSRAGSRFVLFPLAPGPWRGRSLPEVFDEQTLKDINLNKRSCEIYRYSRATQILNKDYGTNQPKKIHITVKNSVRIEEKVICLNHRSDKIKAYVL